jgi:hypothetical protein
MKWAVFAVMTVLVGCTDPRCHQNKYYCLNGEDAENYLHSISDRELIELALLDQRTSRPPSGFAVYEMARRGSDRSRAILYEYATNKVDEGVIDDMVRTFSNSGNVCGDWRAAAPVTARANLESACFRVFHSDAMGHLKKAADQTPRLE